MLVVGEGSSANGSTHGTSGSDGLEVPNAPRFERIEWRVTRVGWLVLAVFVAAGLFGFLGPGPFSWSQVTSSAGGIEVDYQRVTHHEADDSLTIKLAEQTVEDGRIVLELSGDWISGVDVQGITPQPADQRLLMNGVLLEFDVEQPGESAVSISFRAQAYGAIDLALAVDRDRVELTQYVLP